MNPNALWWIGLTLTLIGALVFPASQEPMARRFAATGVALLAINAALVIAGR